MHNLFDNPAAFAPFFTDAIAVEGWRRDADGVKHKLTCSCKACVIDNGYADALVDGDADTVVRGYAISVRAGDWLSSYKPQVGDRIRIIDSNLLLSVARTDCLFGDVWSITAREVTA
jgi:hypothetical protein